MNVFSLQGLGPLFGGIRGNLNPQLLREDWHEWVSVQTTE